MGLIEELRSSDKDGLFRSDDTFTMHPTGLLPLDYANGFWQLTKTKDGEKKWVPMLGIMGGTFTGMIGTTGSGKTTFADQVAWNIVRPFENGLVIHVDAEKTSNKQRISQICGINSGDERFVLNKTHTTIDDVLEQVSDICKLKGSSGRQYMYEAPVPGEEGKTFWAYQPTVFIIDSLPAFNAKGYNVEDLGGNTDGMSAAKETTRFYTNCLDRAWRYNLNFFVINHIKPKVDMNPYAQPPKGLLLLGQGEHLPRGQVAQYYSQTYFRISLRKSNPYTTSDDGFSGFGGTIQLTKSKNNSIGTTIPVAFNDTAGFDHLFSLYEFAKGCGIIGGRNPYLYFMSNPEVKFSRKDFRKKLIVEQPFREAVLEALREPLESLLNKKTDPAEDDENGTSTYGDLALSY